MKRTHDGYQLDCSGREFEANGSILGLCEDSLYCYEGYDDLLDEENFSRAERLEIAHYMSQMWYRWGRSGFAEGDWVSRKNSPCSNGTVVEIQGECCRVRLSGGGLESFAFDELERIP